MSTNITYYITLLQQLFAYHVDVITLFKVVRQELSRRARVLGILAKHLTDDVSKCVSSIQKESRSQLAYLPTTVVLSPLLENCSIV